MSYHKLLLLGALLVTGAVSTVSAAITGTKRIHIGTTTPYYVEKTHQTNWTDAKNYTWNGTVGGAVWEITALGGGLYRIESGGVVLTRGDLNNGTPVKTTAWGNWSTQKWTITANSNGTYRIENAGKALTGTHGNHGTVSTRDFANYSTQQWRFVDEDRSVWPSGDWQWVFRNVSTSQRLSVFRNNTLVLNCSITHFTETPDRRQAMLIDRCDNVLVHNLTMSVIRARFGLQIRDASNVVIRNSAFDDMAPVQHEHSSFIIASSCASVAIQDNTIIDADGNGILTETSTGVVITGNLIDNTGLHDPRDPQKPLHGIYQKAADFVISNNTITNNHDGSCISVRSTGVISGNTLHSARRSVIAYWPDAPAGPSAALEITGNIISQFAYDYSQSYPQFALIAINDNNNNTTDRYFQDFLIQNNQFLVSAGCTSNQAAVGANWGATTLGFGNVRLLDNSFTDQRTTPNHIGFPQRFSVISGNTF